ncbi:UDP-glucuronic acid decarboxylase 6-like protein [Tanacetum coccineum]
MTHTGSNPLPNLLILLASPLNSLGFFVFANEPLTVQSPGTQTRSFCYVSDTVDGLIRLMEGEFIMLELAENTKELINPEVKIIHVENTPDDPRQRKPVITKAKEELGWEPTITLREGLPRMEEDFRKRLGIPRSA